MEKPPRPYEPRPIEKLAKLPALNRALPSKTAITLLQALRKPIKPRRLTDRVVRPGYKAQDRQWFGFTGLEMKLFQDGLLETIPVTTKYRVYNEPETKDGVVVPSTKFRLADQESVGLTVSEKGYRLLETWSKRKAFKPFFDGYMREGDLMFIQARAVRSKMFEDEIAAHRAARMLMRAMLSAYAKRSSQYKREMVKVVP